MRLDHALLLSASMIACAAAPPADRPTPATPAAVRPAAPTVGPEACAGELAVRFYDVGQGLAALVTLDDGRQILVDAGENPTRAGCGAACRDWHDALMSSLTRDLAGAPLDLLWITHQHSDHHGGAEAVIAAFRPGLYVDNGRDLESIGVGRARDSCELYSVRVQVIDPENRAAPLAPSSHTKLTPIVPTTWPSSCRSNPNDCSIALRVDFCASSILFTGDAEAHAERALDPGGPVTLLQVGHHGSDTSTTDVFLAKTQPKYAVISSAKPGAGTNRTYCHPRATTVERLTATLGGPAATHTLRAFDANADANVTCRNATAAHWIDVPASDRLWATARDGTVSLTTTGDGEFSRQ